MPYKYPSILGSTRKNIDEAGTVLLTAASSVYGVVGGLIEMSIAITASGLGYDQKAETVFDRTFSFRWKFYTGEGSANPIPSANGFRFKTGAAVAAAAPMEMFASNGSIIEPNRNFSATLEVVSATQVLIYFRYYCTSSDPNYAPYFVNNLNRLLSGENTGNYMALEAGSQLAIGTTGISIVTLVSDGPVTIPPSPAFQVVTRGSGGSGGLKEYWTPLVMKWHGRNFGNTDYNNYLQEFTVKSLNGDTIANKTHKDTALPHQYAYDTNFVETSASISSFQDNVIKFTFNKGSLVSFTPTAVRVILMRTDNVEDDLQFLDAYGASIAKIPASDTTQNQIEGDIYAPASFVNSSPTYEVSFRIPGASIVYGATYRILCVMYGTTSSEIYSGVSHELKADHYPNIYPKADIYYADYFKESVLPKGIAAYHSGYRARIEVHKRSVADAFTYYGLTGDFDTNVQYVRGDVVLPGTESVDMLTPDGQSFLYVRGAGLIRGQDYQNTTDYLVGAFIGYVDEELLPYASEVEADYYVTIQWEIAIEGTMPSGETILLKCLYQQKIVARRWESEVGQPTPPPYVLEMGLYKSDGATLITPGTQFVCGGPEIVALVDKVDALAGGDAFAIPETYAETSTDGTTASANIKQRRPAFNGYLPAKTNPAINAYDAKFSNNAIFGLGTNDSGARIDIQSLGTLQKFWFVMLARPDNTDETPFIATTPTVTMVRDGSAVTTVTADFTSWRVAFDALLTGADTPIDFRIQNFVTQNFEGIVAGGSGNPASGADVCEVIVDQKKTPIKRIEVLYEIEGTISGHLVRFMARGDFAMPTSAGTIVGLFNPTDFKIMDYDY